MGAGVSAGAEIEVEIKRGIIIFLKITFFFFERCNISVGIIGDFIIIIFSVLEILILEIDLIRY